MEPFWNVLLYSAIAGITIFAGGLCSATFERYSIEGDRRQSVIHTLSAFGGGVILAAVSLILVPKGMEFLSLWAMIFWFLAGAFTFYLVDAYIARNGGTLAQMLVMLLDYVPEALALGALMAVDYNLGLLLAIFIGLQNFPEAFNAYIDFRNSGYTRHFSLTMMLLFSFIGPVAATTGYYLLSDMMVLTSGMMIFASGGILYLIFEDVAPMSKWGNHRYPALGVNFGFLLGMIGHQLLPH